MAVSEDDQAARAADADGEHASPAADRGGREGGDQDEAAILRRGEQKYPQMFRSSRVYLWPMPGLGPPVL